jgi:sodium-dependent dicarboxylate transporter 2/3/5
MVTRLKIGSVGFALGPALFVLTMLIPIDGLPFEAKLVLGLSFWMGTWWVTEAIPLYVTALLPLVVFPFTNVLDLVKLSTFYADRIIFLILGGFFLAAAIEKTNLHQRFAFNILKRFGTSPKHIVGAFILITGSLSAWMSNTATTLLIVPIAAAVLASITIKEKQRFASYLMLSIAFSASIGGIATLIGTPPNAIFASLAKSISDIDVSFGKWMLIGVPVSAVSLVALWAYIVWVGKISGGQIFHEKDIILKKLTELGRISSDEKKVLAIFTVAVIAWISRGLIWGSYLPMIDDSMISIIAAVSLFAIPSKNGRIMEWSHAAKIPWGVLLLIGGGLALAGGFTTTGLDRWVATQLEFLVGMPYFMIIVILLLVVVFMEFISNTATTALMVPIAATLSGVIGINPLLLMLPVTIGASYGFILPASTPPNAIVISSGFVNAKKMARVGLPLNFLSVLVVALMTVLLVPLMW